MNWRDFLTESEKERLKQIDLERDNLTAEYRRIYDRCRKRSQKTVPHVELKTGRGFTFLVSPEDLDRVLQHKWQSVGVQKIGRKVRTGYVAATINCRRVYLHRFLIDAPEGFCVDHIDSDTLNNCRSNLRVTSTKENSKAHRKLRADFGEFW